MRFEVEMLLNIKPISISPLKIFGRNVSHRLKIWTISTTRITDLDNLFEDSFDFQNAYQHIIDLLCDDEKRNQCLDLKKISHSQYLAQHASEALRWKGLIKSRFKPSSKVNKEDDHIEEKVFVKESNDTSKRLIIFTFDFFLLYDESVNVLAIKVPLSPLIVFDKLWLDASNWSFEWLEDFIPSTQIHLIIRRIIQMTGAKWEYDCVATSEANASKNSRLAKVSDVFNSKTIDCLPASLQETCGCSVGILPIRTIIDEKASETSNHCIGLQFEETIFSLEKIKKGIAQMIEVEGYVLEESPEWTNFVHILLGGNHNNEANERPKKRRRTEREELHHNLAYYPKHATFNKTCQEDLVNSQNLREKCLHLGYGKCFSEALGRFAAQKFLKARPLKLIDVQSELLLKWFKAEGQKILSMRDEGVKRGDWCVVLGGRTLKVTRAPKKIDLKYTLGLNMNPLPLSAGIEFQQNLNPLTISGEALSFFDVVKKISGAENLEYEVNAGEDFVSLNQQTMQDILGSVVFLSCLLQGKVNPQGTYKCCVPPDRIRNYGINLSFNTPIPYGVSITTFARLRAPRGKCQVKKVYSLDGPYMWDTSIEYEYPAIMGGEDHVESVYESLNIKFDENAIENDFEHFRKAREKPTSRIFSERKTFLNSKKSTRTRKFRFRKCFSFLRCCFRNEELAP